MTSLDMEGSPIQRSQEFNTMTSILQDDMFKLIFSKENVWISIRISLKSVSIDNKPVLVQVMVHAEFLLLWNTLNK